MPPRLLSHRSLFASARCSLVRHFCQEATMATTPPTINQTGKSMIFAACRRRNRWPALAGALVFACWAALLLPAAVSAAPLEPTPEPAVPAPSETQTVTPTESPTGAQPQSDVEAAAILPNVVAVTAGLSHTCALNATGGILCWGDNTYGQLGTGTRTLGVSNPYPRSVSGLTSGAKAVDSTIGENTAATTDKTTGRRMPTAPPVSDTCDPGCAWEC